MDLATTRRFLPWVVATALFMEQLDSTIVNTGIPASGWLAERYGSRRVFLTAVALFTVSSVLCGLAVGGLIVHWLSWRDIFFVNVPVGLAALWFGHRYMPDYRNETPPPFDLRGLLLFGSGAALLSWLLEIFGEHGLDLAQVVPPLLLSLGLLGAYGWHAQRVAHPLLRLSLLRTRTYRISVLGGFVTRLGVGGMPFLLPLLYQLGLGLPAWQSGLLMGLFNSLQQMSMSFGLACGPRMAKASAAAPPRPAPVQAPAPVPPAPAAS